MIKRTIIRQNTRLNIWVLVVAVISLLSFCLPQKQEIRIFMAGDSTMSVKETRAYPETGWGMPFVHFFDSSIKVENRAKNGRSTRTFISEGLWDRLIADVKEGDYVLIQFGHNDESKEKVDRYTTPEEYITNLKKFVKETRAKKAIPVLLTPASRRRFKDGIAVQTHAAYSPLVKVVALETKTPLIDLDEKTRALYQQYGEETSKLFFLQLAAGEHPNYPEGKTDNTHFNELGARLVAQLVRQDLIKLMPALEPTIVKPKKR